VLNPADLDPATSYRIDALPGRWQPIWCDPSEIVFNSAAGKLLIPTRHLSLVAPGHLHHHSLAIRTDRPGTPDRRESR
jgi:hypothetical protein